MKRLLILAKEYKRELVLVLGLFLLFLMDPQVGTSYLILELFWDFTAVMTAVSYTGAVSIVKYLSQNGFAVSAALDNASPDKEMAWRWFLVNRFIAFAQPIVGIFMAIFILDIDFREGWYGYAYMSLDLLHTALTIPVLQRRLWPKPRVRLAYITDIERLVEIDKIAFPEVDQQAAPDELLRRVKTSPSTNLVLEDPTKGIVGVIYTRPVNLATLLEKGRLKWDEIANGGDFLPLGDADSLYVVGIASVGGLPYKVANILEAAVGRLVVNLGFKAVLGALRIPGFHKSNLSLDDYVNSKQRGLPVDPLLREFVKGATLPVLGSLVVIYRGIEDYFPDPESRNCAALIGGFDPLRQRSRLAASVLDRFRFVRVMWGYLFEKLMLL